MNHSESIDWLIRKIEQLPSDEPVRLGTAGYNDYATQKEHWLGWLKPNSDTGSYRRAQGAERSARDVYNRIVEPKMLLWLVSASGARQEVVESACRAAQLAKPALASKAAAVRRVAPWEVVAHALKSSTVADPG